MKYLGLIALCIVMGFGIPVARRGMEMAHIKNIQDKGGVVTFDYCGPRWFKRLLQDHNPFRTVEEVWLTGPLVRDTDILLIAPFKKTRVVLLNNTSVRGPGVLALTNLAGLDFISLTKSSISDEGLHNVANLR